MMSSELTKEELEILKTAKKEESRKDWPILSKKAQTVVSYLILFCIGFSIDRDIENGSPGHADLGLVMFYFILVFHGFTREQYAVINKLRRQLEELRGQAFPIEDISKNKRFPWEFILVLGFLIWTIYRSWMLYKIKYGY